MPKLNEKTIQAITGIVTELVQEQTREELEALAESAGKIYDEAQIAAEIAVKLALRILGIDTETRAISPLEVLVDLAEEHYYERYAG